MEKGRAQAIAFSIQERGMTSEFRAEQATHVMGNSAIVKHA